MKLICAKCGRELEKGRVYFRYLKNDVSEEVLRCPECGQTYLDEDLVMGRMKEAEVDMEDK